jgi:serine protease SohB
MAFWLDIAAFVLKAGFIVVALGGFVALCAALTRQKRPEESGVKVTSLNKRYAAREKSLNDAILGKKALKTLARERKAETKAEATDDARKRVFVLTFQGDIRATAVKRLAAEVSAVLGVARKGVDEVVVRVESPGGSVTGYGLAASQLLRLRDSGVALTACVDQVAASGGYLMACAADKIISAPFAITGSIGVVAQVPNVHRLLQKNSIDFEEFTAGEFKRSVSMVGEITPAGREHFQEKLGATHEAFKDFVRERRPKLDMAKVANGDYWLGAEALELGLVDALMTSEDYLFRARREARLFEVTSEAKKGLMARLRGGAGVESFDVMDLVAKAARALRLA